MYLQQKQTVIYIVLYKIINMHYLTFRVEGKFYQPDFKISLHPEVREVERIIILPDYGRLEEEKYYFDKENHSLLLYNVTYYGQTAVIKIK
jgi:hypothetical protein